MHTPNSPVPKYTWLQCHPWAFLTRLMKHITGCREDQSEGHMNPSCREAEEWYRKDTTLERTEITSLALSCLISVTRADIGSVLNPKFMSNLLRGRWFLLILSKRWENSIMRKRALAAFCCCFFYHNKHVWIDHAHIVLLAMCVKYKIAKFF